MINLTSSAFKDGGLIPAQYTCDGANECIPLRWHGIPDATKSIAIICDDPDAPAGTWVHWVAFNIIPSTTSLESDMDVEAAGGVVGTNSWGKQAWGGPCPPSGEHRYFFKIYALDKVLSLRASSDKKEVEDAMQGHIIAEGRLMGRYARHSQ
ncbi:MAG TPA: YbhB/YbcL family Raf kinase inhibitor-like protein [Candidatus Dependentiae bacterium]|nr:YbhB/YbcL family Raf kinase inhibitor-like protein [Candidatus Dependentiae bacterium]HRQ62393.1 YbhB/YbcL family Raf kinase inhibitor-like protein [Candidatus Dependentiae bacterium]